MQVAIGDGSSATVGKHRNVFVRLLCVVAMVAFSVGLCFCVVLHARQRGVEEHQREEASIEGIFVNHSFASVRRRSVAFVVEPPSTTPLPIDDGIFWSSHVERLLPSGFTPSDAEAWATYLRANSTLIVRLEHGCGRMQNRLAVFADGRRACVRYRQNTDQIQGELFSFHLAQLLGVRNLAPAAAAVVEPTATLWRQAADDLAMAQWRADRPVVLTQYVPQLDVGRIPEAVRNGRLDGDALRGDDDLEELAQWSDLLIFDYLTANLDRVVNNLYNRQWNANIMEAPAHNLARRAADGLLVFLDNESGLLHGYRLLAKYEPYHALLLDGLCVFRRATAAAIGRLHVDDDAPRALRMRFEEAVEGRVRDVLPPLPEPSARILVARVRRVRDQIAKCAERFKIIR